MAAAATEKVAVGWRGCVTHDFPANTEEYRVVNIRIIGFEQNPSSCASSCGCVSRASFPDAEVIDTRLGDMIDALPSTVWKDMIDRFNRHCRRYVTGGRMNGMSVVLVLFCVLCVVTLQIWNSAAAASGSRDGGDDGGPKWWLFPILPGVACVLTICYMMWVICVRNKSVDKAMRDECAALSAQREYKAGGVSLSFTTFIASIDKKNNPANMLKYVTVHRFVRNAEKTTISSQIV